MNTQQKPLYKNILFWVLIIALVALIAVFVLVIRLSKDILSNNTAPTDQSDPTGDTVETLPPPEENPYDSLDFTLDENGYLTNLIIQKEKNRLREGAKAVMARPKYIITLNAFYTPNNIVVNFDCK